jgi:hypothetical protein
LLYWQKKPLSLRRAVKVESHEKRQGLGSRGRHGARQRAGAVSGVEARIPGLNASDKMHKNDFLHDRQSISASSVEPDLEALP